MENFLSGLPIAGFERLLKDFEMPSYRLKQFTGWLYKHNAFDYAEMSNIPSALINYLSEKYLLKSIDVTEMLESKKDDTRKFIFKTVDGNLIEGVSIKEKGRHTLCVSSQIGCAFRCQFCASGKYGLTRNLKTAEIIDQIRIMSKEDKMTNLVFMGSGEPLQNFDAFSRAYEIITSDWGIGLGQRKITVSTVGFVPGIKKLIESDMRPKLAVSLHAASDEKRGKIIGLNKKYPVKQLMDVCRKYSDVSGRDITFEYIVLPDFNNLKEDAKALSKLFDKFPAKVNLIPFNYVDNAQFRQPKANEVISFEHMLKRYGINVTIRFSKGESIKAACGQLKNKIINNQ